MAKRGFTLIEMLVVLAVLALVMALVPAYLTAGRARAELKSAAQAIAASLRETREAALAQNRAADFVIDLAHSSYRGIDARNDRHLPADVRASLVTTAEQVSAGSGSIRFFPDGSSTGGGVILMRGEIRYEVLVDWLTGRVSLVQDRVSARR